MQALADGTIGRQTFPGAPHMHMRPRARGRLRAAMPRFSCTTALSAAEMHVPSAPYGGWHGAGSKKKKAVATAWQRESRAPKGRDGRSQGGSRSQLLSGNSDRWHASHGDPSWQCQPWGHWPFRTSSNPYGPLHPLRRGVDPLQAHGEQTPRPSASRLGQGKISATGSVSYARRSSVRSSGSV